MDILPSQNAGIKGVFFDAMTLMKKNGSCIRPSYKSRVLALVEFSDLKEIWLFAVLIRAAQKCKDQVMLHICKDEIEVKVGRLTHSSHTIVPFLMLCQKRCIESRYLF